MAPNPVVQQQQFAQMTQRFPAPRLQIDDGNQEMADMHAREDLLLDHYTWVNHEKGISKNSDRSCHAVDRRTRPAGQEGAAAGQLMTADSERTVATPLTSGFARTGYEQEMMEVQEQQRKHEHKEGEQASLK